MGCDGPDTQSVKIVVRAHSGRPLLISGGLVGFVLLRRRMAISSFVG
jgi:hypothetical protein